MAFPLLYYEFMDLNKYLLWRCVSAELSWMTLDCHPETSVQIKVYQTITMIGRTFLPILNDLRLVYF
jgi:hypothetical protein